MNQITCPFCGSNKVKIQVNQSYNAIKASGRCNSCHARGPLCSKLLRGAKDVETFKTTREEVTSEALQRWNNRK